MGIIEDDEVSCSKYMPSDFGAKISDEKLTLTKGTTIEDEFEVIKDDLNSGFD